MQQHKQFLFYLCCESSVSVRKASRAPTWDSWYLSHQLESLRFPQAASQASLSNKKLHGKSEAEPKVLSPQMYPLTRSGWSAFLLPVLRSVCASEPTAGRAGCQPAAPCLPHGLATAAAPQQCSKMMGGESRGDSRWKMGLRDEAAQQLLTSLCAVLGRGGSVPLRLPSLEQHAPGSRGVGRAGGGLLSNHPHLLRGP